MNRFSNLLLAWVRGQISVRQKVVAKSSRLLAYWGILRP